MESRHPHWESQTLDAPMSDVFDSRKRSQVMAAIRGRGNQSTEMAMVALLRAARLTGWRRHVELRPNPATLGTGAREATKSQRIRVRPDFIFWSAKVAVFVDGCFWHGCPLHGTAPKQNGAFWSAKICGNVARDLLHTRTLESAGWKVERVWEHELKDPEAVASRIRNALHVSTRRLSRFV
jgi:DNA mismatch endonuclease (patch repair protein)